MMPESALHAHVAARLRDDGYCIIEGAFPSAVIAALADECHDLAQRRMLVPARIGQHRQRRVDPALRGDSTCWFEADALSGPQARYWNRVDALRMSLNRELLLGLDSLEAHYALYLPGACYARHRDRFRDDDARVLSSVLYLNKNWEENDGGALRIHLGAQSPLGHIDVHPRGGTLVLFLSADFDHEVLPARRERLSIAGWFRRSAVPSR